MASLIEPSTFDLIVLGTGLPQCIVAAAAASGGHKVLHIDSCDFYGSHWTSLPLHDFPSWIASSGLLPFPSPAQAQASLSQSDKVPVETLIKDIERLNPDTDSSFRSETASQDSKACAGGNEASDSLLNADSRSQEEAQITEGNEASDSLLSADSRSQEEVEGSSDAHAQLVESGSQRDSEESSMSGVDARVPSENMASDEISKSGDGTCSQPKSVDPSSSEHESMAESETELVPIEADGSMYSDFQLLGSFQDDLGASRSYYIDLAGPKLAFCAGPLVNLLLRSGAGNYLEFKGLEANFLWTPEGFLPVPSSREDVFTNQTLSLVEKRYLMRFFKLVVAHTSSDNESKFSELDLNSPFADFLCHQQLPSSVQAIILYAIALADDEQDKSPEFHNNILTTREGLRRLSLYLTSVKRFPNASGAFLYPLYGQGELPQAFSRTAAVRGALYVLRMPVEMFLRDKASHRYKGVKTSSGQLIYSDKLVAGPSFYPAIHRSFACQEDCSMSEGNMTPGCEKVVRSICITDKSIDPELATVMVTFPPRSVTAKEKGVIRVLQLGNSCSVCPEGRFLVQLSMACSDVTAGVVALRAATNILFHCRNSDEAVEGGNIEPSERAVLGDKPTLLWGVIYIQHKQVSDAMKWAGDVGVCCMPDETLDYQSTVACAKEVFEGIYPGEVFFPEILQTDDVGDVYTELDASAEGITESSNTS